MSLAQTIQDLREERAKNVTLARKILEGAEAQKRGMDAAEQENWDKAIADAQSLGDRIAKAEKQDDLDRVMDSPAPKPTGLLNPSGGGSGNSERDPAKPFTHSYDLKGRPGHKRTISVPGAQATSLDYARAFSNFLSYGDQSGVRAELKAGSNPSGGYLITPTQMVAGLLQAVDDATYIRQFATVHSVPDAKSLGLISLDTDPDDAEWTSEIGDMTFDASMAFGNRELQPQQLAKGIKISNKLLRQSSIPVESIVIERFANKFARVMESNYMSGNGANKPLGMFTAHADGVTTARDVSTGNTTTSITFDGLKNARFALKQQYLNNAVWIFHRDGVSQIAGLKDGVGAYLWQPSVTQGVPDTIWGRPLLQSEFAPNTFTTGLYVGMIADLSFYHIADSLGMTMQRLIEIEARNNKTEFHWRMETDGMPVLAEAFARVKLA